VSCAGVSTMLGEDGGGDEEVGRSEHMNWSIKRD
jgi:hypothetical protein